MRLVLFELNVILLVLFMKIFCVIESNDEVERFSVGVASDDAASRPPPPPQRAPSSGGKSPTACGNSTSDSTDRSPCMKLTQEKVRVAWYVVVVT